MEQIGGTHYAEKAFEPIVFIENWKLPFSVGNVVKYLCRYKEKGGVQDLRKAIQYLEFVQRFDVVVPHVPSEAVDRFVVTNQLTWLECIVLILLLRLGDCAVEDRWFWFNACKEAIDDLIDAYEESIA